MEKKKPLVTVAVLVYKNFQYIKDCVGSILEQDYPEIQLIISDDGSDIFEKEMLEEYIRTHKGANIKDVYIHVMEHNVGTTRNFNFVLGKAKGKYLKAIAADDLFYDIDSLSKLVSAAESESSDVVIARAPNYDMYLERWVWVYPSDEHWTQMRKAAKDPKTFFGIMSQYSMISTPSVLFRQEFLTEMGGSDERYRLIEDWPLWMRMLRSGKEFTFLDEPVVIYRSGGVSNGKKNKMYAYYQVEHADVIKQECLAYPEAFAKMEQYKLAQKSERRHRFEGERLLAQDKSWPKRLGLAISYLDFYAEKHLDKGKNLFWRTQQHKRSLLLLAAILLTLFSITDFAALWGLILPASMAAALGQALCGIGFTCGWLCLAASILLYAGTVPVTLWNTIKYSAEK